MGRKQLLDDEQVIRKMIESSEMDSTVAALAIVFGVSKGTMHNRIRKLISSGKVRERRRIANVRIYEAV